jgi:hypothetical protein
MDKKSLQESFDCLGLNADATMIEVEKAFHELRTLYSAESLATYSLLEDTDRQEKLASLQEAYARVLQSHLHTPIVVVDLESEEEPVAAVSQIVSINADPRQRPGLFLQQTRKARGLSLKDVAERTKVSSSHLQNIEEQRFDVLPEPVYLRGFLREFARMIKVPDAEALVDSFMALYLNDKENNSDRRPRI